MNEGFAIGQLIDFLRSVETVEPLTGWLHLQPGILTPESIALLVSHSVDYEIEKIEQKASELGFPIEGLAIDDVESIYECLKRLKEDPADQDWLEAYTYYLKFDAFLPYLGAPDPPPWEETRLKLDREFYHSLGPERSDFQCRREGCEKGAVAMSACCRLHHFENVQKRPCPFDH
jgi:hypothetical protein